MKRIARKQAWLIGAVAAATVCQSVGDASARTWEPRRGRGEAEAIAVPDSSVAPVSTETPRFDPKSGVDSLPTLESTEFAERPILGEADPTRAPLQESELLEGRADHDDSEPVTRELVRYRVSGVGRKGVAGVQTAIGTVKVYEARTGETFLDIARDTGLGYNELLAANPDQDPWVLSDGMPVVLPSEWLLPEGSHRGLVLNIPEMRLYYYAGGDAVLTFPVGLGRQDWQTPQAAFSIRGKTVNPTWVIPESIRKERFEEDGLTDTMIPGGRADNPLGKHRLELTLASYAIHGTNKRWGIGMQVSHGCVRLYPEDIEALFPLVKAGTPGVFVYEPVKVGVSEGRVLIEVHQDIYEVSPDLGGAAERALARRGLREYVDDDLLEAALKAATGMPTDIGRVATAAAGRPEM